MRVLDELYGVLDELYGVLGELDSDVYSRQRGLWDREDDDDCSVPMELYPAVL